MLRSSSSSLHSQAFPLTHKPESVILKLRQSFLHLKVVLEKCRVRYLMLIAEVMALSTHGLLVDCVCLSAVHIF
jgi:hypothetical protein